MTFLPPERVRVLAEPLFMDDPPVGTLATVVSRNEYGGGVEVRFPGGSALYFDDELERAQ